MDGNGGSVTSEETKRKLSVAGKGRVRPEETRKKMSAAVKKRYLQNPEQFKVAAIAAHEANRGRKVSEDTKQKLSEKMRGNNYSKGNTPWNKGRLWTEEERVKMRHPHKKRSCDAEGCEGGKVK